MSTSGQSLLHYGIRFVWCNGFPQGIRPDMALLLIVQDLREMIYGSSRAGHIQLAGHKGQNGYLSKAEALNFELGTV